MSDHSAAAEQRWVRETLRRHFQTRGQAVEVGEPAPFGALGDGFASKLFTVETRAGSGGGSSLVVKILPEEPQRTTRHLDKQFINEAYFYGELLPFLLETSDDEGKEGVLLSSIGSSFPKYFCARHDSFQSMVAISNLEPLGFKLAPKCMDYPHMRLSLQELGRFHALSYFSKKRRPKEFKKMVDGVISRKQHMPVEMVMMMKEFLKYTVQLFVDMYPELGRKYANRIENLDELTDKYPSSTDPVEPLAVLCHGDFNRNNILFKHGSDGEPLSLALIDFQLTTYSSPAVDLSLILFLSTSPEVRQLHWDDLLSTYHGSLLDTLEKLLRCDREVLEKEYSMELFMEDFKRHCLHGFLISVFFLPIAMLPPSLLLKLQSESSLCGDLCTQSLEDCVSAITKLSTESVKLSLAKLLKEVLEKDLV